MGGGREGVADSGRGYHPCQSRLPGSAELAVIGASRCGHVHPLGQLLSGRQAVACRQPRRAGVVAVSMTGELLRILGARRAPALTNGRPPGAGKSDACARDQQVRSAAMRVLPVSDPGTPNITSPWRYLGWLVGCQKARVSLGVLSGCTWMVSPAQRRLARPPGGGSSGRSHLGRGFAQAVDKAVDGAVETSYARGINNGCPVDEKRILKMSPKGLVLRAVMAVEISHH